MGRWLIFVGIVLIFASIIFMGLVFGIAGEDVSAQIITPFACEENESLTQIRRYFQSYDGSGYNIDFFCEDSEGIERDVTITVVFIIIIGFGSLLTAGIIAIFSGAVILSKNTVKNFTGVYSDQYGVTIDGQPSTTIDMRDGSFQQMQGQLTPELRNIMKQASSQLDQASGGATLADKLKQLENAYEQRLISREEYDKARSAILENMED